MQSPCHELHKAERFYTRAHSAPLESRSVSESRGRSPTNKSAAAAAADYITVFNLHASSRLKRNTNLRFALLSLVRRDAPFLPFHDLSVISANNVALGFHANTLHHTNKYEKKKKPSTIEIVLKRSFSTDSAIATLSHT